MTNILIYALLWVFSFSFGFLIMFFVTFRMALYMDELERESNMKKLERWEDE